VINLRVLKNKKEKNNFEEWEKKKICCIDFQMMKKLELMV